MTSSTLDSIRRRHWSMPWHVCQSADGLVMGVSASSGYANRALAPSLALPLYGQTLRLSNPRLIIV